MAERSYIAAIALVVALALSQDDAIAQNNAECNCPPPKLVPITGHVVDAVTGKPIAGAVVDYFDSNPPVDRAGNRVRQPIVGEVKSAADGSYALPADLPSSSFHVRASAPGYFSAGFHDWPSIVGHPWPADFPPRPSHDLRLEPSHDLVAIGSSLFPADQNSGLAWMEATAAALPPDGRTIALATRGPRLWIVSLPELHVTEVPLPEEITKQRENIEQVGWDGTRLIFNAGNETTPFVGGASAPDYHVTLVPAPSIFAARVSVGTPNFNGEQFTVEEVSNCDDDDPSPHCGQGGSLVVHDIANRKTIPIKSGGVDDLSYLLNPTVNEIVFSDPVETSTVQKVPVQISKTGTVIVHGRKPGLTLLDLKTGLRSHIELPGDGSRTLTLLAEVVTRGGLRVVYTQRGDCDPNSTDAAQPFAPSGLSGETPNAWGVCVVTVPVPPPHALAKRPAAASTHILAPAQR